MLSIVQGVANGAGNAQWKIEPVGDRNSFVHTFVVTDATQESKVRPGFGVEGELSEIHAVLNCLDETNARH